MRVRRLTKNGLMVPELGLGAMDTPQSSTGEATIRCALDAGIHFIDTARGYEGSEFLLGRVIRNRGAKDYCISTKTFSRTRDGAQHEIDRSLNVLGLHIIDLYQLHDVSTMDAWEQVMRQDGALAGLQIAKSRRLIEHIGISSHNLGVLELAITSGQFDTVMLEYSAFFPETKPLISLAQELGIGVIAMRPLGGSGRMSNLRTRIASGYEGMLTASILLRYVLSNPGVSVAIPGVRLPARIKENVRTASTSEPLTKDEMLKCEEEAKALY